MMHLLVSMNKDQLISLENEFKAFKLQINLELKLWEMINGMDENI